MPERRAVRAADREITFRIRVKRRTLERARRAGVRRRLRARIRIHDCDVRATVRRTCTAGRRRERAADHPDVHIRRVPGRVIINATLGAEPLGRVMKIVAELDIAIERDRVIRERGRLIADRIALRRLRERE